MCQNCSDQAVGRRSLLKGGLALGLAAPFISMAQAADLPADGPRPETADEAFKALADGNARYVANQAINTDHSVGRTARSQGQQPFAAVVTCADSRVVPELIFDQAPGDLFVVRVAGNFINEDGLASLEYAAAVLGIKAILVLGHTSCGAVDATIKSIQDNTLPPGHLPSLVNAIRPAVYDVMGDRPADLLAAATAQNAKLNARKAETSAPILSEFHSSGKIKSAAAIYDIAAGKVSVL
ncbi:carbonic anhydrase [Roseibium suaedae]|uniref:carbonic anhydrase n=1 Tax=Roseibium suaedae TaxID=735517 RepID=A0A1M6ZT77_9HYPH|nr:carbonic anhydrase [Roseibium suaedae]SHL33619.1 carbonic anhydrase [Roseibium suaedae]